MNEYVARDSVLTVLDWDCASQDALDAIKAIPAADAIEELSKRADEWEILAESWQKACKGLENRMPRWIPVTERLPGREWVLCKCRAKIHEVLSLRDGYWYHDPQHQYMRGFVTHWMPLPEPPKEEE